MAMMEILVKVSIGAVSSTVREKIRKGEKEGDSWKKSTVEIELKHYYV